MINELDYLRVPTWLIFIAVSIVVLSTLIKALQGLWEFIAPTLFGIQTKLAKKKKMEEAIWTNQEEIKKLKERQDSDHVLSKEGDAKLQNEIVELKNNVQDIAKSVLSMRIDSMRTTILDFASSAGGGRTYSKEQYDVILQLYKDYEALLEANGMNNGVVKISAEIIEEQYKKNILNHGFLEDKLNKER